MDNLPVFVKVDEPSVINDLIIFLRNKIEETKSTLNQLESLSFEESDKISGWKSNFEDLIQKIEKLNNSMLEPERI